MIWTGKQIAEALFVQVDGDLQFGSLQFNSNDVRQGDLFIALMGETRDGHEFVPDALKNGATAAIVSKEIPGIAPEKLIIVDDCLAALSTLARYKRENSKAKFIGITGSVGKTSTKELLRLMLEPHGKTFASRGTFNNHLGVPLNLASMPDNTEYAIIEMGMNAPGEIALLTRQVRPDIAVITSVSEGHIEFLNSVEEIAEAKCEIFQGLSQDGIAVLNRDITTYTRCLSNFNKSGLKNLITFGKHEAADVKFSSYEIMDDGIVRLQYILVDSEIDLVMHKIPEHLAANFAAGFGVISALGLDLDKSVIGAGNFKPVAGRGLVIEVNNNNKKNTLICDYYNSNPESLSAALRNLATLDYPSKVAIIGDMLELGTKSADLHKSIVPLLAASGASKVFLVGLEVENILNSMPSNIECAIYPNVDLLLSEIDKLISTDELILIKGSKGIKLFKVAQHFGVKDAI